LEETYLNVSDVQT